MRHIDIVTTAIPRPLLRLAVNSFFEAFVHRHRYHVRWLFHLDQHPRLMTEQCDTMREASELSKLFDEAILIRSKKNIGFIASAFKLLKLSQHPVIFVEDDWYWSGRFLLHRIERELELQDRHAFSFRNTFEYVGAMGCCYWTRTVVDALIGWRRPSIIITERDVKRLMRYHDLRTLTTSPKRLHDCRPVRHMGPRWAVENGLGRSTRID